MLLNIQRYWDACIWNKEKKFSNHTAFRAICFGFRAVNANWSPPEPKLHCSLVNCLRWRKAVKSIWCRFVDSSAVSQNVNEVRLFFYAFFAVKSKSCQSNLLIRSIFLILTCLRTKLFEYNTTDNLIVF